jgi:peptidoglycan/xylan/chitin deacetylase (PgdA/CDA1 family)
MIWIKANCFENFYNNYFNHCDSDAQYEGNQAMSGERDLIAKGAMVTRLDKSFRWPDGNRIAIFFNIAFEAWTDGKGPGIGPMGNPLPAGNFDTNALSFGNYGPVRGIWRLLDSLEHHKVKAGVMVSGVLAERHPDAVKAVAAAGHDVISHCYGQDVIPVMLSEAAEKEDIAKTTQTIAKVIGSAPKGWMSPRATPSTITYRLLAESGYLWHGDAMDDDLPYVQDFSGKKIVAVPFAMEVNDFPIYMRYGNSPQQYVEAFKNTLARMRDRETGAVLLDATAHAHVFGRPLGAWAYEAVMEIAKGTPGVWIGTRTEAAKHVLKSIAGAR